ncbi:MAG: TetR/AcrR family transcriptional regulator [Marmoricola sp.]|jgi:AcrR family transcriptional regulator|nr:TetR/AcrR family transcriptional regulator [Marmoricola sp.]
MMKHVIRPRVEGVREDEILDAAAALLIEVGYDRFTMDAVARNAHASKATLYRRWESKPALVTEALVRAKNAPHVEDHDTGSLRSDLIATFCGNHGLSTQGTKVLGAVVTALSTDPEFAELFREMFIAPKIAVTARIYERARERGEIAGDVDLEIIGPALAGILLHRTFILGIPPDDATVERVVDNVILPAVLHPGASRPDGATKTSSKKPTRTRKTT